MLLGRSMKSGKWITYDKLSEIWPLSGVCKFQFENKIDFRSKSFDQLMKLEHLNAGRGGQSRLKSSLTAGTVIRAKGQAHLDSFQG